MTVSNSSRRIVRIAGLAPAFAGEFFRVIGTRGDSLIVESTYVPRSSGFDARDLQFEVPTSSIG